VFFHKRESGNVKLAEIGLFSGVLKRAVFRGDAIIGRHQTRGLGRSISVHKGDATCRKSSLKNKFCPEKSMENFFKSAKSRAFVNRDGRFMKKTGWFVESVIHRSTSRMLPAPSPQEIMGCRWATTPSGLKAYFFADGSVPPLARSVVAS
jgi:hypothetical protein